MAFAPVTPCHVVPSDSGKRPNPLGDSSRRLNNDDSSSSSPNHGHILDPFSTDQPDKEMLCECYFVTDLKFVCSSYSLLSLSLWFFFFLATLFYFSSSPLTLDDVTRTVHDPWARSENNYFATCKKSMRISITACDQELAVPMQVNN